MNRFLIKCRNDLMKLNIFSKVGVVFGTEACDLDSAVSSIVASYLKHNNDSEEIVLPVMNIKRADLLLKTEVKFLLDTTGISFESLICRDEIDIEMIRKEGKLLLTLVDHNVLATADQGLEGSVIEIFDHHKDEHGNRFPKAKITIEPVGSCATLIAERMIKDRIQLLDVQVATILWGTILLDTVCLSTTAQKTTEKDIEIIKHLETILGHSNRNKMFRELQNAKSDTSGLTGEQLLRKDLKAIQNGKVTIAVAAIPVTLEEFCSKINIERLATFCSTHSYDCLVVMSFIIDETDIRRQLAVYSLTAAFAKKISSILEMSTLQLRSIPNKLADGTFCCTFEQGNRAASRKVVLPLLRSYLEVGRHD